MKKISLIVSIIFFLSSSAIARNVCNCKGYDGPGGPCYAEPGGPAYAGPGGPAYAGPGGPCNSELGGRAYAGPGGLAYAGEGGPCYEGEGGPCYSGPGGGWSCPSVCSKCTAVKQEQFEGQLLQNEFGE